MKKIIMKNYDYHDEEEGFDNEESNYFIFLQYYVKMVSVLKMMIKYQF